MNKKVGIIVFIFLNILCLISCSENAKEKNNINIKQKTEQYKIELKNGTIPSACEILEKYQASVDEVLPVLNRELVENKHLYKKIEQYGKFQKNRVTLIKNKDKEIDVYFQYLNENGLKIGYSEGNIYLYFDPSYISTSFKNVLPHNVIEYYSIDAEYAKEGFEADSVLTIPWDSMRNRIVRYEAYLNRINKVNCSYLQRLTRRKISFYLTVYMLGLANSSIEDKIIEAKSSYENFLRENKKSIYYQMIEKYYDDLKRNDFKFRRKEEAKETRAYKGPTILDKNGKQVYIDEVAKKYLELEGLTIVDESE